MSNLIHAELSNKVLDSAFTVHRSLGPGLLEAAYEGAIIVELMHHKASARYLFLIIVQNENSLQSNAILQAIR